MNLDFSDDEQITSRRPCQRKGRTSSASSVSKAKAKTTPVRKPSLKQPTQKRPATSFRDSDDLAKPKKTKNVTVCKGVIKVQHLCCKFDLGLLSLGCLGIDLHVCSVLLAPEESGFSAKYEGFEHHGLAQYARLHIIIEMVVCDLRLRVWTRRDGCSLHTYIALFRPHCFSHISLGHPFLHLIHIDSSRLD